MISDQQRRELHLEPAELENLQFTVLDLEELKQLHSIAKRSPVRSLLSRQIANLEAKSMQKEVLPNDIDQLASSNLRVPKQEATEIAEKQTVPSGDQLASSNLRVPKQEATEIAEKQTVPSGIEILANISSEIIESKNNQVMREENSSLHIQLAEGNLNRKRKEIEKSESSNSYKRTQEESNEGSLQRSSKQVPERNKRLEENCNESNSGVPPKKFPSRSARRKYAQRQLKKEMKRQAKELQNMPRNGGDTTMNEITHGIPSRPQQPTNMDFVRDEKAVEEGELQNYRVCSKASTAYRTTEYAQGQLKKETKRQARELQSMPRNGGDTTMKEIPHRVPSRRQQPTNMDSVRDEKAVEEGELQNYRVCSKASTAYRTTEYAQGQLKKETKRQARELQSMPRNGGDTTMNEIPHLVPSRRQLPTNMDFVQCVTVVDTVCLERLHQTSNPVRIECEPHYTTMVEIPHLVSSRLRPPTNMDFVQYRTSVDTVWPERLHQTSSRDRLLAHYLAPSSHDDAVNANIGNALGPTNTRFRQNTCNATRGRSNASISRGWTGRR